MPYFNDGSSVYLLTLLCFGRLSQLSIAELTGGFDNNGEWHVWQDFQIDNGSGK